MYRIVDGLARLTAPILPVTAEQLWKALPGKRDVSVHLAEFPDAAALDALVDPDLNADWQRLLSIRSDVNVQIEARRKEKLFGTSLGAQVAITAAGDDLALLRKYESSLPMLFIVSDVRVQEGAGLSIATAKADGVKCDRCWRDGAVGRLRYRPPGPLRSVRGRAGGARGLVKRRLELAVVVAVALLDQATKLLVVMELGLHETIEIVPGLLNLTHVRNSGVAFGFLNATSFAFKPALMAFLAFAALIGVALYATQLSPHQKWARTALALDPWRRGGQSRRSRASGLRGGLRGRLLGLVAFLGVQRRRRRHQRRRGHSDTRSRAASAAGERWLIAEAFTCFRNCSSSARSPSTHMASCWRPRICLD